MKFANFAINRVLKMEFQFLASCNLWILDSSVCRIPVLSRLSCNVDKIAYRITGILRTVLYFSNNPDYSRLIYYVAFSDTDAISLLFRSWPRVGSRASSTLSYLRAVRSRETIVPPVHCSIMQRRLNPGAALRSDFKGDTFPDGGLGARLSHRSANRGE